MSKSDLRAQLRLRRRELSATHPDAAEQAATLLPLAQLPPFTVVSGYHPLGGEIDPWPTLRRLANAGARIAADGRDDMRMRLHHTNLPSGCWTCLPPACLHAKLLFP